MHWRRIARPAFLGAFLAIQTLTPVFDRYPALEAAALLGVGVVFLDAVICARRRWRSLRAELSADGTDGDV